MFTGIIETLGKIKKLTPDGENLHIVVESSLAPELQVDQSVSHNGVCLTVVALSENTYTVTAIKETLDKTNLSKLSVGSVVNLERAMKMDARLDGHIVQGHVDQVGVCSAIKEVNGSWYFTFTYDSENGNITIEKGSITVNGVSLTVVQSEDHAFSVAIIPYTYEHTNFNQFQVGTNVNLEFDVIGKYVKRLIEMRG
ncbi:MAG TPA: riboflavin synthase [Flavobacteriaceae bacterium]|nr:riboflavin synthase [Flavobacteriaceae bacterium]MAY52957.1 riboflavin synthase [Flavobacteriaceae bacterium]HBR55476.1 riboflavin synthase [Flavobacteriaceae bacterium]|tara:strand:+ start:353 stop:943 length:591 start_codon:yes stop_codon:yes gene_type:complete